MMSSEEDLSQLNLLQDNGIAASNVGAACSSSTKVFNNNKSSKANVGSGGSGSSKRVRQRVDAGEPRNSYAAIPNFTSRLTNGYIVSSAGSKLISDLLARQRVSSSESVTSMTVEMDGSNASRNNGIRPSRHATAPALVTTNLGRDDNKFANGNDESTSDLILNQDELVENSYLLRSILQDRKNFREACVGRVSPGDGDGDGVSSVTDSDHDLEDDDMMMASGQDESDTGLNDSRTGVADVVENSLPNRRSRHSRRHREPQIFGNMLGEAFLAVVAASSSNSGTGHASENAIPTRCGNVVGALQSEADEKRDRDEGENGEEKRVESRTDKMSSVTAARERAAIESSGGSAVSSRSNSPSASKLLPKDNNNSSLQEIKRARVETIVSNMLHVPGTLASSGRSPSTNGSGYPEPAIPVNGCKKRKLYQPIQHDSSKTTEVNGNQYFNEDEEELEEDLLEDELLEDEEPTDTGEPDPDEEEVAANLIKEKKRLEKNAAQLKQVEQRYHRLYESSPTRSEELNSVEDQIKRDCDSDVVRDNNNRQKSTDSPSSFRPGRGGENCLNLPNVYYVSTPKERRDNFNGSVNEEKRKSEDRQSCIVKTTTASVSSSPGSRTPVGCPDLEWLVDSLKSELSSTLSTVIDSIVSKYAQRRSAAQKASRHSHHHHNHKERPSEIPSHQQTVHSSNQSSEAPIIPPDMPLQSAAHKEFNILSQMLDRKSPRTKVIDRGNRANGQSSSTSSLQRTSPYLPAPDNKGPLYYPRNLKRPINPFLCVSPNASLPAGPRECHSPPTPPTSLLTAAALGLAIHPHHNPLQAQQHQSPIIPPPLPPPASLPTSSSGGEFPEQTEAMSLVVVPKKKRQKVTDTRITPRTVSRLLVQEPEVPVSKYHQFLGSMVNFQEQVAALHHAATVGHPALAPPPLVPVSLPTTVAIPNPSLHQSDVFNPFHFDSAHRFGHFNNNNNNSTNNNNNNNGGGGHNSYLGGVSLDHNSLEEDSLAHGGSPSLHSSMMGGPRGSPDSMNHYSGLGSFKQENGDGSDAGDSQTYDSGLAMTSTLTPMHLRKAKLMFFYVRYPSSAILKMYFPDIKFNKNNTAQLVKWFSNFREFYYIQMEKYARQAISDGVKNSEEIKVSSDAELIRVLNLHYNRNNHIEVPENFRYVVEQTLREFFKALLAGKDSEQSWKKAIYKVIARLDDGVPEYFKTPNFLEQLE